MKPISGPLDHPSKPRYAPPPDACDGHCHVFGPAARFPYVANRPYTPPDVTGERLAALHRHLGFSRAILVQATCHGSDNSAMLEALRSSHGAWRGVAIVDADVTDDALATLHDGGVRGVRFNFVAHLGGAPDLATVSAIVARIAPLGWHVELHLDARDIPAYRSFLVRLPVPFIIDHMGRIEARHGAGQPAFRALLDLLEHELAWVKVSGADRVSSTGSPYSDAIPLAQALVAAAPDRVLWGTDFPHPNVRWMPDDGELVDLFARICGDDATRRAILVTNPDRLYWPERLPGST